MLVATVTITKCANPNTTTNPNTNHIPNPTNPKLKDHIPTGLDFTICQLQMKWYKIVQLLQILTVTGYNITQYRLKPKPLADELTTSIRTPSYVKIRGSVSRV